VNHTRNGGPLAGPAVEIAATFRKLDHSHSNPTAAIPTVPGEVLLPAGRRRLAVVLVRVCPWCSCGHLHRTEFPGARSWQRTGSCGKPYRVEVRPR
jgi:hypothetical protein